MIDPFVVAVIKKICQDNNWRFNSTERQLNYGTISLILNGSIYEISKDFMVRRRVVCKNPNPYAVTTNSNMYQASNYIDGIKYLYKKFGRDKGDTTNITYMIQYKTKYDLAFKNCTTKTLDEAKQIFKYVSNQIDKHSVDGCAMLIELYGIYKRLISIKNTYIDTENVNNFLKEGVKL